MWPPSREAHEIALVSAWQKMRSSKARLPGGTSALGSFEWASRADQLSKASCNIYLLEFARFVIFNKKQKFHQSSSFDKLFLLVGFQSVYPTGNFCVSPLTVAVATVATIKVKCSLTRTAISINNDNGWEQVLKCFGLVILADHTKKCHLL